MSNPVKTPTDIDQLLHGAVTHIELALEEMQAIAAASDGTLTPTEHVLAHAMASITGLASILARMTEVGEP